MIRQAVILSAGYGTRMRELTADLPKPMLPLFGKPMLEWQLIRLRSVGIQEILINLHYKAEKITKYFGDGRKWGVRIHYSREKVLMGTGGAYLAFKSILDTVFLTVNVDTFLRLNLTDLVSRFRSENSDAAMVLVPAAEDERYTPVWYENGRVRGIGHVGEPVGERGIFTGVQILTRNLFRYLPAGVSSIIDHFYYPLLRGQGRILAWDRAEDWIDLGTKEFYLEFTGNKENQSRLMI